MAVKDGLPSTDFSRMNREYIKEVAEGSAGSALPEITESDEGKVLTVESGEAAWATAGGGGGGGVFFVEESEDEINNKLVLNKTASEIITASATSVVILKSLLYGAETTRFFYLQGYMVEDGYSFDFSVEDGPYNCDTLNDYPALSI